MTRHRGATHTVQRRVRQGSLAGLALLSALAVTPGPAAPADAWALVGGVVIDGHGGPPLADAVVLVEGDRIKAVGRVGQLTIPAHARVLDTEGRTVLPGLIDAHAHLGYLGEGEGISWPEPYASKPGEHILPLAARQLLSAGVTTVRDPYCGLEDGLRTRRRIEAGELPGPRLFISGPALTGSRGAEFVGRTEWGVGDAADARRKVARLAEAGVDVIKLLSPDRMAPGVAEAIVDEARRRKVPTTFHALSMDEVRRGLLAGASSLEHLEMGTAPQYPSDVVEQIRERNRGLYWIPTLGGFWAPVDGWDFPERLDQPEPRRFLPPDLWSALAASLRPPRNAAEVHDERRIVATFPAKLRQLRESGVTLVVGSDSGTLWNFHAEATWREMWRWETLGVPPMETIRAATYWAARLLGRTDLGVVEPGALADLIVVEGNPLESVRDLRRVDAVMKGGRIHVRDGRWVADGEVPERSARGWPLPSR